MGKKLAAFVALAFILVLSVNLTSAYYYDWRLDYRTDSFSDVSENTRTTISTVRDWDFSETIKHTTTDKIEIKRKTKTPSYRRISYRYRPRYVSYYDRAPYSNWRYKEPYNSRWDRNSRYNHYYEPRYDGGLGHYNWRW